MKKEIKMFAYSESALCTGLKRKLVPRLLSLALACLFVQTPADANPVNPQVVNGKVIFNKNGNLFTITNTPGAIINWQDFSIDSGEITRFIQENANSAVLNRIVGQNPTQILGALQSNGRVFLINPNGVLFGKGAQVDVNGLTVSSLGMSDADFKAGKLNFDAGVQAGKVSNQGAITTPAGGHVYLIAPDVENSGIITSPNGEVLLTAGRSVKLVDSANPDVQVVVSAGNNQAVNLGQVIAQGGRIGIYGTLVTQRGLVSADSAVVGENGKIYFKASQDTILDNGSKTSATSASQGGDIRVLGQRVAVAGNAQVDASGATGGGQILLGGDYHGANPGVMNAQRSFVSADASINADATKTGDGGKVIVWSDDMTRVNGVISARGGALGGNGGFVETSGKQNLDFNAKVNVSAARGNNGTLLLDPASITLTGGGVVGNFQGSTIVGTINFADAGPTSISQGQLQGLAGGTNIVLEATNYIDTSGVFSSSQINLPLNSNLTLRTRNAATDVSATRGINLTGADPNLAINASGTGTITLQAGTGAFAQVADIQVARLATSGTPININSSGKVSFDKLYTTPASTGAGGDINVTSVGGGIVSGSVGIDARGNASTGGNVTLSSGFDITEKNGATFYANNLKMTADSGMHGTLNTDNLVTQASQLNVLNTGSGDINLYNTGALNILSAQQTMPGGSANITIDNGGLITLNNGNAVRTSGGSISLTAHGALSVDGTVSSSNNGNITLEAGATGKTSDKLTVGATGLVSTSGAVLLKAGNSIVISGIVNGGTVSRKDFLNGINQASPGYTIYDCISDPNLFGCSSILPSLSSCISNSTQLGCSVVLPSLSSCISNSSQQGCSVVLPSLSSCISNSSQQGCSVVLPSLSSCISNSTQPGCSVVLPSLSACMSNPSLQGCSVVLPSAATCQSAPTTPGCSTSLPGLSTCIANPNIANCSQVLPSVATCKSNPDLQGCNVVIPSYSACLSNPSIYNCSYVLLSISSCIDNPAQSGCSYVLPTLSQCVVHPSMAGCSVILPSITSCMAVPATPGCAAVLPSIAACTNNPALLGCSAILPSLAACLANSSLAGCSAVLPGQAACAATPTLPGCSTVLPTLNACIATPALAGCSSVLPTLTTCQANPSTPGCSAVLPTLTTCIATPSLAGCNVVLPTLASCTSNPSLSGCAAILPTLAACTANPGLAGCSAVLPSIAACTATPSLAGCSMVLPTLAVCTATPTLPGCSAVLPSLASCIANPGLPACNAVLPGLAACITAPATPGCSAVLPSIASCTANPSQAGCSAVLPSLATCTATPATTGCSVVLPSLNSCIANSALPGCSSVLPTLANCIATPFAAGCSVVLPSLASCLANPATAGCSAVLPTLASCIANPALSGCSAILPSQSECANHPDLSGCSLVLPVGDLRTADTLNISVNSSLSNVIGSTLVIRNSVTNSSHFFDNQANDSGKETKTEKKSSVAATKGKEETKNASENKLYCK